MRGREWSKERCAFEAKRGDAGRFEAAWKQLDDVDGRKKRCVEEVVGEEPENGYGLVTLGLEFKGGTVNGEHVGKLECLIRGLGISGDVSHEAWHVVGCEMKGRSVMVGGREYSRRECQERAMSVHDAKEAAQSSQGAEAEGSPMVGG